MVATDREVVYKGKIFKGSIFNGSRISGVTHKYSNGKTEIKFTKLPLASCPILFKPSRYTVGHINNERMTFARTGKGFKNDFYQPSLKFSCSRKLFDYIDDADAVMAMAVFSWWVLYEQNSN